jgi:hypothetical protein
MNKNPKTLINRARHIQEGAKNRHKSEGLAMYIARKSRELYLSEGTVWKDYVKKI